jgi:hypothetical protein
MAETALERLTTQGKAVSADVRSRVLEDAKARILAGETLLQIAQSHGIAKRTLEYWLANLGDEYAQLRQLWVDNLLAEAGELLETNETEGTTPERALRLARARELWKRATWYAERRDSARYGVKQEIQHVGVPVLNIAISAPARHNTDTVDAEVIDN